MEANRPKSNNKRTPSAKKTGSTPTPVPAPKLTAKGKLEQKKRLAAEQERKKLEAEQQQRREIDRVKNEELRKKMKEESDRLELEMPEYYELNKRFEGAAMTAATKEQKQQEWNRFIEDSEMVDIDEEKELSKIIYGVKQVGVSWNKTRFQRWILYIFKIIGLLRNNLSQSRAVGNKEKIEYYSKNLEKIYEVLESKFQDEVRLVIDGIENLLATKNKELAEKGLLELTYDNEKRSDFNRKQDRFKYEIYQPVIKEGPCIYSLWINLIKAGFRAKPVTFENAGFDIEIPRQFLQSTVIISCMRSKYNQFSDQQSKIKCFGDIIQLNIYQMVALPRVSDKFTLKNVTDLDQSGKSLVKKYKYESKEGQTLLGRITLPPVFYVGGENNIIMAHYTPESGWTQSNQVQIDPKNEKIVKFQVNTFNIFSLALPKTIDYPYKSFFLRCIDAEEALLDLQTKRIHLQFSIKKNTVSLLNNNKNIPELTSLYNQEMMSAQLLTKLEKIGIIINPTSVDVQQVPGHRTPQVQDKVIKDIGFSINSFAFKNSSMNISAGQNQAVILSKVHIDFEPRDIPDDQYPWESYLFESNKCSILNPKLKAFKEEYYPGTTTHISLIKAVEKRGKNKMEDLEHRLVWPELYPEFVLTLKSFLKQLKLFSLPF